MAIIKETFEKSPESVVRGCSTIVPAVGAGVTVGCFTGAVPGLIAGAVAALTACFGYEAAKRKYAADHHFISQGDVEDRPAPVVTQPTSAPGGYGSIVPSTEPTGHERKKDSNQPGFF